MNDSIVPGEFIEYYFQARNKSSRYQFKKQFFKRNYDGISDEIQIMDSIILELTINNQYKIKRIDNWHELYTKIKVYADNLLEETSPERRANLSEFIEKVVLDSVAIVNKNTQDIQVYLLVLKEFRDSLKSEGNNFHRTILDSIETIQSENTVIFQNGGSPFENISFLPDSQNLDYKNSITAKRNLKSEKF